MQLSGDTLVERFLSQPDWIIQLIPHCSWRLFCSLISTAPPLLLKDLDPAEMIPQVLRCERGLGLGMGFSSLAA